MTTRRKALSMIVGMATIPAALIVDTEVEAKDSAWDEDCQRLDSYPHPHLSEFKPDDIAYGWYVDQKGDAHIVENGIHIQTYGEAPGLDLTMTYEKAASVEGREGMDIITYLKGGAVVRRVWLRDGVVQHTYNLIV